MKKVFATLMLAALITGCSAFVRAPKHIDKGDRIVCVLYKQSDFKDAVIKNLTETLADRGYRVIADSYRKAKHYPAADFAAVVYMADYWAWHTPLHAKRYYRRNHGAVNIVVVVTSGDPDVTITEPFDAITGPSKEERVGPVADEILRRIEPVLR